MGPVILAIESSCDETSASVISNGKVLNNIIATQQVHLKYGGVVPELASRAHQRVITTVVSNALCEAQITPGQLNAVAFTSGPGLMGSLLVGTSFAKGLAVALRLPLIEVNHLHAHVLSHFITMPHPSFPFLCLTVSGGHTQIVRVDDHFSMTVLGETQDDAVGEAFDKAAKMLGLDYPGGPLIDHHARHGNPRAFDFPDTTVPGLDFSFSGIKTALLYFLRDRTAGDPDFIDQHLPDICASLQHRLVSMLLRRLIKASEETGITTLAVAGGVAANSGLRSRLNNEASQRGWDLYVPALQYCTDNAAMIALTAHLKYERGLFSSLDVAPRATWELEDAISGRTHD